MAHHIIWKANADGGAQREDSRLLCPMMRQGRGARIL
jgi:hypothetical protein